MCVHCLPLWTKGYKVYYIETHKILISRDIVFKENIFPFQLSRSQNSTSIPIISGYDENSFLDFNDPLDPISLNI